MKQFLNGLHKVSFWYCQIAVGALVLMMVLTTIDVFGRYLFNHPIMGAMDIVEQMMIILVYGALGYTSYTRAHIRADLMNPLFTRKAYAVFTGVGFSIAAIAACIWAWQTIIASANAFNPMNRVTPTIRMPIAPFYAFAALGLVISCFEMIVDIIRYFQEAKSAEPGKEVKEKDEEKVSTIILG